MHVEQGLLAHKVSAINRLIMKKTWCIFINSKLLTPEDSEILLTQLLKMNILNLLHQFRCMGTVFS